MLRVKFSDDSLGCKTGEVGVTFEATGRYAEVPPKLQALRDLRTARLRGFEPMWSSVRGADGKRTGQFRLDNEGAMRRLLAEALGRGG
jgi:hypothetical protein